MLYMLYRVSIAFRLSEHKNGLRNPFDLFRRIPPDTADWASNMHEAIHCHQSGHGNVERNGVIQWNPPEMDVDQSLG